MRYLESSNSRRITNHFLIAGVFPLVILFVLVLLLVENQAYGQVRGVTIEGVSLAKFARSQTEKAWAVVVGINAYRHVPHLSYAVADAKSMAKLLEQQNFSVVSFFDAQATRQAILSELGDRLPTMVGESDRVVVFFAGHGETRQFGMGSTMGYLLPVESKPTSLSATAIDMGVIRTLAQALPAKQVLFLIDVCYGGIAGQRFRSLSPLTAEYMKVITREKGRQLITAGGSDQQAIESPEWGHSAFTYFLLNGLGKGLADLNGDGIIPASELYTYLDQRVYSAAQLIGHTQRPELWRLSAEQGEFVFFPPSASSGNLLVSTGEEQVSNEQFASLQQQLEALQSQVQSLTGSNLLSTPIPPPSSTPESEVDKFFSPESKEAGEPLEEQCEKGNGEVCFHLASGYVLGSGNTKDLGRGMGLFEKGCRMEHYDSCTALGSLLWIGDGVPQDRQLALALWEFSCKHGSARACQLLRKRQSNVG